MLSTSVLTSSSRRVQRPEAGGHGLAVRSTLSSVLPLVDALAVQTSDAMVLAAGHLADGRGLAAALMLGADGVLMGRKEL